MHIRVIPSHRRMQTHKVRSFFIRKKINIIFILANLYSSYVNFASFQDIQWIPIEINFAERHLSARPREHRYTNNSDDKRIKSKWDDERHI